MSLISYLSFEAIFKRRSETSEFVSLLSKFTAESLLWNCAALNLGLRVWDSASEQTQEQDSAIQTYFVPRIALEIVKRFWSRDQEVLLHRRQLLLLQKLAIAHGTRDGMDVNLHPKAFGILLLMANDHLHNPNFVPRPTVETVEDYVYLMSELLPISETGDEEIGTSFIRTRKMLGDLTQARKGQNIWFDAAAEFESATGITHEELDSFLLGLTSYVNARTLNELWANPGMVCVTHLAFKDTNLGVSKILRLFDFCSSSMDRAKQEILKRDFGFNDVTALRTHPVINRWWNVGLTNQWCGHVILDPIFLSNKALTAPYWISSKKYGDAFRRFWGDLFEDYMNQFMVALCRDTQMIYIPDPRAGDGRQICDGMIIEGDTAILFEYKSFMLSAEAKYHNVPQVLQEALTRNLVQNSKGKPKGARQLSAAVETLFNSDLHSDERATSVANVKTVIPCIVTLDSVGGAIGINGFLQHHWTLTRAVDVEVLSICCIPIDTLEKKSGTLRKHSFGTVLKRWMQINPSMGTPLGQMELGLEGRSPVPEMDSQMHDYFEKSMKVLFANG
jgi:hypothetical protein